MTSIPGVKLMGGSVVWNGLSWRKKRTSEMMLTHSKKEAGSKVQRGKAKSTHFRKGWCKTMLSDESEKEQIRIKIPR